MKKLILILAVIFISCTGTNKTVEQSSNDSTGSPIVGKVGNQNITYSELSENYGSGGLLSEYSLEEISDFLPVYLDYKAKILSAEDEGYFEDERILNEYDVYAKQAAYAYWIENEIRPTMFNEYKYRFNHSMKSSHLLIALDKNPLPKDTLEAYTKLIEARNKFLSGTSMSDLDNEYSTVRQGRSMGGDLPWFSVGTTVKQFEDVLYSLEIGEISMPVRTQFGYHIILLENMREQKPERSTSHIFRSRNSGIEKLDSAYKVLLNGGDWDETVSEFTDDMQSKSSGGKIGWINYGSRYDAAFIDTVMNLEAPTEFSKPFNSIYGSHIIRIDSVRSFESEEAKDEYIMQQLKKSSSYKESNSFVLDWITKKYNESENLLLLDELIKYISELDSAALSTFSLPSELADSVIYTFNNNTFTTQSYLNYLKDIDKDFSKTASLKKWFYDFKEFLVDSKMVDLTLNQFPEFVNQISKYKSGLVVYQINEDSVWSSSTIDTTNLISMYDENPEEYSFGERYSYHLITSSRDSSLNKAISFIKDGNSPDSLISKGFSVGVISDSTGSYSGEPFDKLSSMQPNTFSDIFEYNKRKAIFYLNDTLAPRKMTYQEAFNKLVSDYQPIREQKWLINLRKKYKVQLFMENLKKGYEAETNSK